MIRANEILSLLAPLRPVSEGFSQEEKEVLKSVKEQYLLSWNGIHGISHWMRVYEIGMRLASETGANRRVVGLFALLHDSCRESESTDSDHGKRAAAFIDTLQGSVLNLGGGELDTLKAACYYHSEETCHGNITMKTCYDADRLDLGRRGVNIVPDPNYLCTDAAKNPAMIAWAYKRGRS